MQSPFFDLAGRLAEQAREGGAEAAVRIEAGVEDRVVDGRAVADAHEGLAQAARAAVGLEGHAEFAQEVAADAGGFESHLAQAGFADAGAAVLIDGLEQAAHPIGRGGFRGAAALAGAVAGEDRVLDGGEELDIFRERLARRAGGQAENAGGADGGEEQSVIGGVGGEKRALHLGARR